MGWSLGKIFDSVGDFLSDGFTAVADVATLGVYSDIMDAFTGEKAAQAQHETNMTNLAIAQQTNDANKDLWREQMQYNSPENQMIRLKKAGLNPQLAYGGVNNIAAASSPPTMQGASMEAYTGQTQAAQGMLSGLLSLVTSIPEINKVNAETKLLHENAESVRTVTQGQKIDNMLKDLQTKHSKFDLDLKNDLRQFQLESAMFDVDKKKLDISLGNLDITQKYLDHCLTRRQIRKLWEETKLTKSIRTEQDAKNALWKAGINPSATGMDLVWGQLYKNPDKFFEQLTKILKSSADTFAKTIKNTSTWW